MRLIEANGITLATESFGDSDNQAMLLVMGATASMRGWPDELCIALAAQGLFVIRYDHRDTGQSTTVAPGTADYTVEDLASDALAVLEGYGQENAHLVGMSLGGYICQMLAVEHPGKVLSLTLIASEPLGWDGAPLPNISQQFLDHFADLATLDWADHSAVANFLAESERLCAGTATPFDESRARIYVDRVLARTDGIASMFNHGTLDVRKDWSGAYRRIGNRVLVVHGSDDPILPIENGQSICAGIPGARFERLETVGHELPVPLIPHIAETICRHALAPFIKGRFK
jgi:pimeloyl-ACP methyl ester carboxylesterase